MYDAGGSRAFDLDLSVNSYFRVFCQSDPPGPPWQKKVSSSEKTFPVCISAPERGSDNQNSHQ